MPEMLRHLVLIVTLNVVAWPDATAAVEMDRSAETPDLMQTDPSAGLPFGGSPYCGPVSAANSMVWLSKHGFPKLAPGQNQTARELGQLSLNLAHEMKTTRRGGTIPTGFLRGLESYVKGKGYEIEQLRYQGWEEHPERFDGGAELPELPFIQQGFQNENSAVWLKIGWYKYFPADDKYVRFAGHWVTVVGMGDTGPETLKVIVHDSAPRSGAHVSHEEIAFTRIEHGKLITGFKGLKARNASGFYKMGGELKIKQKADFGLLDGVVVLKLK